MSETGYLILSIVIIISLIAIFFVTYVLNHKTKVPKCDKSDLDNIDLENIELEKCMGCHNVLCSLKKQISQNLNEDKKEENN